MSDHLNEEQLTGYVHYTLTDAERETLDAHLNACAQCRARLGEYEALQRRIRYSLASDMKAVSPPSGMSFAAVAPRLQRPRWWERLRLPSGQFVPGATALAALVGLAVALVGLYQSLGWSSAEAATIPRNPLPVLACGCFAVTVMGNFSSRVWPVRLLLIRTLAFLLWIGTAIVGLQVIVVVMDLLMWLASLGLAAGVVILSVWPLCIVWIALVVGGGEYHYQRLGQRSSWRLFGWTITVELLILMLPYVLGIWFVLPRFWS
jgi:anti-sigma factor RsiW